MYPKMKYVRSYWPAVQFKLRPHIRPAGCLADAAASVLPVGSFHAAPKYGFLLQVELQVVEQRVKAERPEKESRTPWDRLPGDDKHLMHHCEANSQNEHGI